MVLKVKHPVTGKKVIKEKFIFILDVVNKVKKYISHDKNLFLGARINYL